MATTVPGQRNDAELTGSPFDLAATAAAKPRSRLPEVLSGTLLVALFALAGVWFYSTSTSRDAYLAVRQEVSRGEVVERDDLTVYQLNTDAPLNGVPANLASSIVGQVALADLSVGTLVTPGLFAEAARIPSGAGIVGLDLGPGEFPTFGLRPGDLVRVIAVPPDSRGAEVEAPEVLAERAEVAEVGQGGSRGLFVALIIDAEVADRVAVAAARDQIRLIQVGERGGS